jgi:hypothetical protein
MEYRGKPLNAGPQVYSIFTPFDRAIVPAGGALVMSGLLGLTTLARPK